MFVNEKEIFKFRDDNKKVNFSIQFFLQSIFNGFGTTESTEASLTKMCAIFQLITMLLINLTIKPSQANG